MTATLVQWYNLGAVLGSIGLLSRAVGTRRAPARSDRRHAPPSIRSARLTCCSRSHGAPRRGLSGAPPIREAGVSSLSRRATTSG
jgi:hypothetical protein